MTSKAPTRPLSRIQRTACSCSPRNDCQKEVPLPLRIESTKQRHLKATEVASARGFENYRSTVEDRELCEELSPLKEWYWDLQACACTLLAVPWQRAFAQKVLKIALLATTLKKTERLLGPLGRQSKSQRQLSSKISMQNKAWVGLQATKSRRSWNLQELQLGR